MVVPEEEQNQAAAAAMAGHAQPFSEVGIGVPVSRSQEMGLHPMSCVTAEDPDPVWILMLNRTIISISRESDADEMW